MRGMPLNFLVRHLFVANQEGMMAPVNSDDETAKGSQVQAAEFPKIELYQAAFSSL